MTKLGTVLVIKIVHSGPSHIHILNKPSIRLNILKA